MPEFNVTLVDDRGRKQFRRVQAISREAMVTMLKAQGLWLLSDRELNKEKTSFSLRLPTAELQSILQQLVLLLRAGVTISTATSRLAEQYPAGKARFFLSQVASRVGVDGDAAAAFGQFPRMFTPEMVMKIQASQSVAMLPELFERTSIHLAQKEAIRATVKKGTIYPAICAALGLVVFLLAMLAFIPRLKTMLEDLSAVKLPATTRALFSMSEFLQHYLWLVALLAVGFVFLVRFLMQLSVTRHLMELLLLRIPRVKDAIAGVVYAEMSSSLSMLYGAGTPLEAAVEKTAGGIRWLTFRRGLMLAREQMLKGDRLAAGLERTKLFPPMVTVMVSVGEETGSLSTSADGKPGSLDQLAEYYATESRRRVELALALVEPILITLLALFIGWVVVASYQPIASIYQSIRS